MLEGEDMEYIELIILYVLSILMIIKPKLLWKIENIFTVKNGEPTDFYIAFLQIVGVFLLIGAVIGTVCLLL